MPHAHNGDARSASRGTASTLKSTENKKASRLSLVEEASCNALISQGEDGAGDEIRTHDPNLGKVVLYP